ncbi:fibronectin type III domain-containing protein 4 isoform X2 [Hirundo rustica]|uniref:fibronectin type III domain-containing protein 4 isoform X2 n=1 Tax=Hirundo rustica TaxID=43150 RepID=UPI001A94647B|nr:fibronectin type III domain-containing protein 4 isoform X2 [Hirundo rustica]
MVPHFSVTISISLLCLSCFLHSSGWCARHLCCVHPWGNPRALHLHAPHAQSGQLPASPGSTVLCMCCCWQGSGFSICCATHLLRTGSPDRPPSPVNVTVTQLKANSATVSWDVPEGDVVIGYAILQQRQDGQMQRFIREVNTTNRACVLWDLAEDADYIIQVQSIGLYGESQASKRVHFRTLKETDRLPSNSSNQGDITMEGLDKDRQLQTGEIIIIVAVLLMWAAVIALFCRQYDIIKDNDSNNNKEKTKPSSEHSTPERPSGGLLRSKKSPSVNIIEV